MAFNPRPDVHVANWSEDGTAITVPIASFPQLTAAEADGVTGDIRKLAYALCHKLNALYNVLPAADRPGKFTASVGSSIRGDTISRTFTFSFTLGATGIEVVDEG